MQLNFPGGEAGGGGGLRGAKPKTFRRGSVDIF